MTDDEEEPRSRRQIRREELRDLGERSSRLAADFMKMSEAVLVKLDLDEDTRDAIKQARATKSHIARRRAERQLAGDLRRLDIEAVEKKIEELRGSEDANARRFHEAERWRARFVAEGTSAIAAFPGGGDDKLRELIDAAQRSKPGSSKALFRYVAERLKAAGS